VRWYLSTVYGQTEGPGITPFYCDRSKVGAFAVQPEELVTQSEAALFRLFVGAAMFQARRDVLIMRQQRTMARASFRALASSGLIRRAVITRACPKLSSAEAFDLGCDVSKKLAIVDCRLRPRQQALRREGLDGWGRRTGSRLIDKAAILVRHRSALRNSESQNSLLRWRTPRDPSM
jgi:hypothetical protein